MARDQVQVHFSPRNLSLATPGKPRDSLTLAKLELGSQCVPKPELGNECKGANPLAES
jgi:hypothetical protein